MLSEQWDKEREGREVETTQGERVGEKADGCFWCGPPPLFPFSLHGEPRPCLLVLIILWWPFLTNLHAHTDVSALPSFITFFVI